MNDPSQVSRPIQALLMLWAMLAVGVALTLRVEGYDGYWYLSNAWYLAGGEVSAYEVTKAPLLALLYLPLALARRLGLPEIATFMGSHLLSVGLTGLTGWLLHRVLRRRFSGSVAAAAVFAFLCSRIVFRYAAFAMSDLPAALAALAALEAVERGQARDGMRARLPLAAAFALAVLARYPAAMILPLAVAWDLAVMGLDRRGMRPILVRLAHHLAAGALATAIVAVVHAAVYAVSFSGPAAVATALGDMVTRNARLGGISVRGLEPWWEYAPSLALACTIPVALLMVAGVLVAIRHGGRLEALHGGWVALHLMFISAVSSHKEARYLLPALPSLFLFALWGGRGVLGLLRRSTPGLRGAVPARALGATLMLAAGIVCLVREGRSLSQPFFRQAVLPRMAAWMEDQIPAGGHLAWAGNFYPRTPPRHVFDRRDEYYYIYHLAPHVLEYYSGRQVLSLRHLPVQEVEGRIYPLGGAAHLRTGDQLLSSVAAVTVTATLDRPPPPLWISPVTVWDLRPGSEPGSFLAAGDPVRARLTDDGGALRLSAFPGPTEVLVHRAGTAPVSLGVVLLTGGESLIEMVGITAAEIQRFTVAHYGTPRAVPATGPPQ